MGLLDSFRDLPPPLRILAVVFTIVSLWLGIHCVVIIADGNRNPSLPMSTPCPMLNASMMPSQCVLLPLTLIPFLRLDLMLSTGTNWKAVKAGTTGLD